MCNIRNSLYFLILQSYTSTLRKSRKLSIRVVVFRLFLVVMAQLVVVIVNEKGEGTGFWKKRKNRGLASL